MLTFMWSCRSSWCYAHAGWAVGWCGDVNAHVKLQKQLMLRTRGVGGGVGRGCQRSCEVAEAVDATHTRGGRWGGAGMLTLMWSCRSSWCYAHAGWAVGWGGVGVLTFMWSCRSSWCYAHAGWAVGWGGDVNVHVKLQKQLMLRTRGVGRYLYIYMYIFIYNFIYG